MAVILQNCCWHVTFFVENQCLRILKWLYLKFNLSTNVLYAHYMLIYYMLIYLAQQLSKLPWQNVLIDCLAFFATVNNYSVIWWRLVFIGGRENLDILHNVFGERPVTSLSQVNWQTFLHTWIGMSSDKMDLVFALGSKGPGFETHRHRVGNVIWKYILILAALVHPWANRYMY
jgi:hypothetical protein